MNPNGLAPDTARTIKKLYQLPTEQGAWEAVTMANLLTEVGTIPAIIGHSPQRRGKGMAELVKLQAGWATKMVECDRGLNDLGSDLNAQELIPKIVAFSQENSCSVEEAVLLLPEAREYIFERNHDRVRDIQYLCGLVNAGDTVFMSSHGGSIEPTVLRLLLLQQETPLIDQTANMLNVENLSNFGGMLGTGEAFTYTLILDDDGNIVAAENIHSIRLPDYPLAK